MPAKKIQILAYIFFIFSLIFLFDVVYAKFFERLPPLKTEIYLQLNSSSMHQRSETTGLFYEMKPNFTNEHYNINSWGMRDNEPSTPKDKYRILVLGDSVTFGGKDLNPQQLFTEIAEARLREQGLSVEILNAGVNGYNTRQELIAFKHKFSKLSPNMVIFAFCINDLHSSPIQYNPDNIIQKKALANGAIIDNDLFFKNLSEIHYLTLSLPRNIPIPYQWDRYLLLNSSTYRALSLFTFKTKHKMKNLNDLPNFLFSCDFEGTLQNIRELSEENNFLVKFMILPFRREYDIENLHKLLMKNKISFWDLNNNIPDIRTDKLQLWYEDGIHLTISGHHTTGELLAEKLAMLRETQ
ncbi:MAG: SGNH/GDSL hydrolase family protein [PVC group bacterium]|nr:SGNH/GDSL hydrolase family protein [PVC group bacterium]